MLTSQGLGTRLPHHCHNHKYCQNCWVHHVPVVAACREDFLLQPTRVGCLLAYTLLHVLILFPPPLPPPLPPCMVIKRNGPMQRGSWLYQCRWRRAHTHTHYRNLQHCGLWLLLVASSLELWEPTGRAHGWTATAADCVREGRNSACNIKSTQTVPVNVGIYDYSRHAHDMYPF